MKLEGPALDLSDEANKMTHLSWIQERTPGDAGFSDDELVVVDSELPTDTFNVVCRARLSGGSAPERILTFGPRGGPSPGGWGRPIVPRGSGRCCGRLTEYHPLDWTPPDG